jgi:hypothetical protein
MIAIKLPREERELANVAFERHSGPMAIGITDRAVYVLEADRWSLREQWRTRRVPIEQIRRVTVRRMRRSQMVLLSLALMIAGGVATYVMVLPFREGHGRWVSAWPIIAIIGGMVLPFTAHGRRTVHIEFVAGRPWVWKPPLFAAEMTKQHIDWLIEQIVKGFRRQRIYVSEE